jgi:hypothetical protein
VSFFFFIFVTGAFIPVGSNGDEHFYDIVGIICLVWSFWLLLPVPGYQCTSTQIF